MASSLFLIWACNGDTGGRNLFAIVQFSSALFWSPKHLKFNRPKNSASNWIEREEKNKKNFLLSAYLDYLQEEKKKFVEKVWIFTVKLEDIECLFEKAFNYKVEKSLQNRFVLSLFWRIFRVCFGRCKILLEKLLLSTFSFWSFFLKLLMRF